MNKSLQKEYSTPSPDLSRCHSMEWQQIIPTDITEVFDFFCNEKNLELLTPNFLNFKVLNKSTPLIEEGTTINYTLKLHGFPISWKTLILTWKPGEEFVDYQLEGPYKIWHHRHQFSIHPQGTLMKDILHFQLPFGFLSLPALPLVKHEIETIFSFRKRFIEHHWGTTPSQ